MPTCVAHYTIFLFSNDSQGLPKGAIQNALQRDELDPSIMDLDPNKSISIQHNKEEEVVDNHPPLKEDPTYKKYFGMLKMVCLFTSHIHFLCLYNFVLLQSDLF